MELFPSQELPSLTAGRLEDTEMFQEIRFDTAQELIDWLSFGPITKNQFHGNFLFRGEDRIDYTLLPSSLRDYNKVFLERAIVNGPKDGIKNDYWQIKAEYGVIEKFYDLCDRNGFNLPESESIRELITNSFSSQIDRLPENTWIPKPLWEIAGLAQHYGLPTRLLDWTYNFNIALFFASQSLTKGGKWRSIWALFTPPFKALQTPLIFIRPQYARNAYLTAQQGIFTTWQAYIDKSKEKIDNESLEEKISSFYASSFEMKEYMKRFDGTKVLYKLDFFHLEVSKIIDYLNRIGYNDSTIFPSMEGIAKYMKESVRPFSIL